MGTARLVLAVLLREAVHLYHHCWRMVFVFRLLGYRRVLLSSTLAPLVSLGASRVSPVPAQPNYRGLPPLQQPSPLPFSIFSPSLLNLSHSPFQLALFSANCDPLAIIEACDRGLLSSDK